MYNWDPGAHFGMYKPDDVLVRRHAGSGRLGGAERRRAEARISMIATQGCHGLGASRMIPASRELGRRDPGLRRRLRWSRYARLGMAMRRDGSRRRHVAVRRISSMLGYLVHRILIMIPTLIAISIVIFIIIQPAARRLLLDLHRRAAEPGRRRQSRQDRVSEGAIRLRQAAVAAIPVLGRRPAARRHGLFVPL